MENGKNKHEANRFFCEEEKIITQRENKEIKPKRKKNETKRKDPTKRSSRTNEKNEKWWKTKQQNKGWENKRVETKQGSKTTNEAEVENRLTKRNCWKEQKEDF